MESTDAIEKERPAAACRLCPFSNDRCGGQCLYAQILDRIQLGMIGVDTGERRVFYQNAYAREIFDGAIEARDFEAFVTALLSGEGPADPDPSLENPARMVRLGDRFIGYTVYRISERHCWIYALDITEKERLKSIAEAVNIMDNTGYIFSGIRHELGNPLNSIKMTLHVLRKNLETCSREKILDYVERLLGEVERAEYLLKALRNFSMYETPRTERVEVRSFLGKFVPMVRRDFGRRGIRVETEVEADVDCADFDPRALQQVLLNLLTNAADALEGNPDPAVRIRAFRAGSRLALQVRDNGRGMSREELEGVFKPFYTTKAGGTGLGMVIVRKMMTGMNGTVEIESRKSAGTTVTLTLPLRSQDPCRTRRRAC